MSKDCPYSDTDGDCCCNCIHQRNMRNPKGFENDPPWMSYCDLEMEGRDEMEAWIFLKPNPNHGMCEMHERKP